MKIVIVSDNHGDSEIIKKIENMNQDADLFLHAGDSEMSAQELFPFKSVKGNRDYLDELSSSLIFNTPIGILYLCHGHHFLELSKSKIKSHNCKIFIHGHYHKHYLEEYEGIYIASPGSTSRPRDHSNGTYLIITFADTKPIFEFKYLD